jgi:hypothetical protein
MPREIALHPPIEIRNGSQTAQINARGVIVREAEIRLLEFMRVAP